MSLGMPTAKGARYSPIPASSSAPRQVPIAPGRSVRSLFPEWQGARGPLHLEVLVPRDASLRLLLPFVGIGCLECTLHVRLTEPGASAEIIGCHIGEGASSLKVHLTVSHEAPDTRARTLIKNAMADQSAFDFRGLIRILPEAVRSDDHLEERALLLSRDAKSLAIPALEILTDDVKASHAAASGKLDPQELFYLQSRGISYPTAFGMLLRGFFEPICRAFPPELLPPVFSERIEQLVSRTYD